MKIIKVRAADLSQYRAAIDNTHYIRIGKLAYYTVKQAGGGAGVALGRLKRRRGRFVMAWRQVAPSTQVELVPLADNVP